MTIVMNNRFSTQENIHHESEKNNLKKEITAGHFLLKLKYFVILTFFVSFSFSACSFEKEYSFLSFFLTRQKKR